MCSRRQIKGRSSLICIPMLSHHSAVLMNNVPSLLFLLILLAVEYIFTVHLTELLVNKLLYRISNTEGVFKSKHKYINCLGQHNVALKSECHVDRQVQLGVLLRHLCWERKLRDAGGHRHTSWISLLLPSLSVKLALSAWPQKTPREAEPEGAGWRTALAPQPRDSSDGGPAPAVAPRAQTELWSC